MKIKINLIYAKRIESILENVATAIASCRLLPVVVLERAEDAVPLARSLVAGGLPIAEITFRSEAALDSISRIADEVPDILLGAGTVLSPDQVEKAKAAGAKFVVTPGFNQDVVACAMELELPIVPGINNPTGVEQALVCGLDIVKFFPAEASGGVAFLKALAGPYRTMRFIPTGGIGPQNIGSYLSLPSVLACGGSWMVDINLIKEGAFERIEQLTKEAVEQAAAST